MAVVHQPYSSVASAEDKWINSFKTEIKQNYQLTDHLQAFVSLFT